MKKFYVLFFLISTTAFGQSWQWGKRGGSSDNMPSNTRLEEVYSIATDSNKNIYLLSSVGIMNLNFDGNADSGYSTGGSVAETALVSFSCDGTFRWSKIIGGLGSEQFRNVQVDGEDNVYIAGNFGNISGPTFAHHIDDDVAFSLNPVDTRMMVILKYNSNGVFQWYKKPQPASFSVSQSAQCYTRGLQIDAEGILHWLVYVIPGTYADGAFVKPNDGQFWYVFKYDAAGSFIGATPLEFHAPGPVDALKFFRNPYSGNYFLTARSVESSGSNWATIGSEPVNNSIFLAAFNPVGQALWKREDTTTTTNSMNIFGLAFDSDNNIYIGGGIVGLGLDSFMGHTVTEGISPGFVMKLDSGATTKMWSSNNNQGAAGYGAVVLNGNELAYTSLCAGQTFTWGTQVLNATSTNQGTEVLFARFDKTTGACLNLTKIPGNPGYNDYGTALAVDASGDYILGGNFSSTLTFDGGAQITSVGGQSDFFIAKYATEPCSDLGVDDHSQQGKVFLYPNPGSSEIQVSVQETVCFEVFDLTGKKIMSGSLSPENHGLNIELLSKGFYLLNLQGAAGGIKYLKFLKR